ncbi:hypothetical protein G7L40_00930 [Paenibacillus polymyxa]|uniref:Uncharacterized protein n=1 Tax=Paenibacillus polymyxa TaxID=1406 RepID=A0A378XUX3_PAEPO|nr:hypothetical protein [Paenibacillus polymyxa]MBE7897275.1 hypothetical protein [Paenibacillus polymyxa]MBG9763119.1 hypothetical protein [Paenibacillus polymyxa]MBG9766427.1 hypothetical protein [Paenibacillus polymyxa]MCC3257477.1 hypothetical protein [Paenibacillus polymyxa]QPK51423.1 hypothetical protein G7035_00925 [Paenibacillus polymyxa]
MNFLTVLLMCIPLYAAFRAFTITRDPEAKKRIPKTTLKALTFFAYFIFIVLGFFIITEGVEYLSQL